ncbi:hypothetical protein [Actinomadura sp. KC216]|uniref:GNAT family N-acetyltransferase n=1 Tax=Actinomadura sp. KC216 TaxID=2530370 RepID=UPI001A9CC5D4|nr:hypothetical protein [Actinomadura sp. KC216]
MNDLFRAPRLVPPTTAVRESFLAGEWSDCLAGGAATDWLDPACEDFGAFVAERRGVQTRWGVPCSTFWYVSGERYLGTLIVRHRLTAELAEVGGHIGYHVVPAWRRQGHATRMLAAGAVPPRDRGQRRRPRRPRARRGPVLDHARSLRPESPGSAASGTLSIAGR